MAGRGQGAPAGAHIGDQQVDGVRADVENSQAHAFRLAGRTLVAASRFGDGIPPVRAAVRRGVRTQAGKGEEPQMSGG
ncbi:hypothetical protein GCM10025774_00910 [Microbacterium kyungheense]